MIPLLQRALLISLALFSPAALCANTSIIQAHTINTSGKLTISYSLSLKLPTFSPTDSYAPLTAAINNERNQRENNLFAQAAQNNRSINDPKRTLENHLLSTYDITRSGHITSGVIHFENYNAPAAHPQHTLYTFNYDTQHRALITQANIFKDSTYLTQLCTLARQKLVKQGIEQSEALTQGTAPNRAHFSFWSLDKTGMTLYFTEYQVAAYVQGEPSVHVSLAELTPYLTPYGKTLWTGLPKNND